MSEHDPAIDHRPGTRGFLSFTLHAHLPWVVHHGAWPHGMEWVHEAAAETYLPLLRVLTRLERDGIALCANLNLSPILLEQLAHPAFQADFPRYLDRKIASAREDEALFLSTGEQHFAALARSWQDFFATAMEQFHALGGRIHEGFRRFHDTGSLELITSGATHGYLPLLGNDDTLRAHIRTAIQAHQRHFGLTPRGFWLPECGYRPAGEWSYPVRRADGGEFGPPTRRIGIEQALRENGIDYFLVDSHLADEGAISRSTPGANSAMRLYEAYSAGAGSGPAVFPRDPRTGAQVWSSEQGYPADAMYLDFHKRRWPGGHRYWRVTGAGVDIGHKASYDPEAARQRIRSHAEHFVSLVWDTLEPGFDEQRPPIVSAPFDAELFGHWWFEGPEWLEQIARILHTEPTGLEMITGSQYLDRLSPRASIVMPEGSWGAGGGDQVWLNHETEWTYRELYAAETEVRALCDRAARRDPGVPQPIEHRLLQQLCRELLLLESSDWQFLITTGAARDYAEQRFRTHRDQLQELGALLKSLEAGQCPTSEHLARLGEIEQRDSIFADIDPRLWCSRASLDAEDDQDLPAERSKTDASAMAGDTHGEVAKYLAPSEAHGEAHSEARREAHSEARREAHSEAQGEG